MRKLISAGALAGIYICAGVVNAGPQAPSLATDGAGNFTSIFAGNCAGFSCLAGEGAAVNTSIGPGVDDTAIQHLDWLVVHDGNASGGYTYYYQLENSSIAALGGHTIATKGTALFANSFLIAGDLDANGGPTILGHNNLNFANLFPPRATTAPGPQNGDLKPELESEQKALVGPTTATVDFNGDLLVTFAAGLAAGSESNIYGAQGSAPVYGAWNTQGAEFTWNTEELNPCSGPFGVGCEQGLRVPVPGVAAIPEPAQFWLLGASLLTLGFVARRRRQSFTSNSAVQLAF